MKPRGVSALPAILRPSRFLSLRRQLTRFSDDISAELASGMTDHVSKPLDVTQLCKTLSRVHPQNRQLKKQAERKPTGRRFKTPAGKFFFMHGKFLMHGIMIK